jgi:ABC-2 type transport system permease protein
MSLLTEGFAPFSGAMQVAPALALLGWAMPRVGIVVTPGWLMLLALSVLSSAIILLAYTYVVGSLAFWAPRAAEEINSQSWQLIAGLKQFPLDGAGPLLTGGLLTAVPVGFVAWFPCRALLGLGMPAYTIAITPLAAGVATVVATGVFRKGLRAYGRTGSQRYLSFGHRR